jgi:hypothetical protein
MLDGEGEPGLYFLGAFMENPDIVRSNPVAFEIFKQLVEELALDSSTGEPAYPH